MILISIFCRLLRERLVLRQDRKEKIKILSAQVKVHSGQTTECENLFLFFQFFRNNQPWVRRVGQCWATV